MSPTATVQPHRVPGYLPWRLCVGADAWSKPRAMDRVEAQRAIATQHRFLERAPSGRTEGWSHAH